MADYGRMEVETGMAHIYGYPDPNAENVSHNEPGPMPRPTTTGTFGSGHTTGTGPGTGPAEHDYPGHGDVGKGVEREAGGYGADDGSGRPGTQNLEQQQPAIDQNNMEMGPSTDPRGGSLSPNRGPQRTGSGGGRSRTSQAGNDPRRGSLSPNRGPPQRAGSEGGLSQTSQAGNLTPVKQRVGRDFSPELPPRPQAQATDNDKRGQMYQ